MPIRITIVLLIIAAILAPDTVIADRSSKFKVKLEALALHPSVKLTIITPSNKNNRVSLQVERNEGAGFYMLAEISQPKRKEVVFDNSVNQGFYAYRVRLNRKDKVSLMSKESTVNFITTGSEQSEGQKPEAPAINKPPPELPSCKLSALPAGITACPEEFNKNVFEGVNAERLSAGVPALSRHALLDCSSRVHTSSMIAAGYLSHDGWYDHISQSGYAGRTAGQNLAYGFTEPAQLMDGWMNSPGHKVNILNPKFTHIGISCLMQNGVTWVTQDFGG